MSYPVLYAAENFKNLRTTQGLGTLSDCISCTVTEERNGPYELEMKYPMDGVHFDEIVQRAFIVAQPNATDDPQAFRIYDIQKEINGIATIYARHISYDLSGMIIEDDITSTSTSTIASYLTTDGFNVAIDISSTAKVTVYGYKSLRSQMLGDEILGTYGGEWHWDNYTCTLLSSRGADNGAVIKYGKNMTALTVEEDSNNVYSQVAAFWRSDSRLVGAGVNTGVSLDTSKYLILDFSDEDWDDMGTTGIKYALTSQSRSYIASHNLANPLQNISVSFVQDGEVDINLCDTVTVIHEGMGISTQANCIKVTWDVLKERYTNTVVGDVGASITKTISELGGGSSSSSSSVSITVDSAISSTSTNPVQNKVIYEALSEKVTAESGKGLSTNDYTTAEQTKLAGIETGAEVNVQADWEETDTTSDAYILNKPTIPDVSEKIFYGTCTTAAATRTKVVECADFTAEDYDNNPIIFIKFTNAQTYNGGVILNINSTGNKYVARVGSTTTGERYYWLAGELVGFAYDGTNWMMLEAGVATTTYYGVTKLSSATNSTSTALAATASAVKAAYDLADSKDENVQSDWDEEDTTSDAYINNKPDIPSASSTTPVMDGTASVGTETAYARGDHVHPTDATRAPIGHASTATTYGIGTSSNYGHVKLSDSTTATTAAASGGTAATPKAVSDALTAAKAYADGLDTGVSDVTVNGVSVVSDGVAVIANATASTAGTMSSADKVKVDTLGDMAFADIASSSYTPAGTVSQPTFSGTQKYLHINATKDAVTSTGSVSVSGTAVTAVSHALDSATTSGTDTVLKDVTSVAPTFSGTQKYLHLSTTKDEVTSTGSYTPAGTVSQPTFTGTTGTVTVSGSNVAVTSAHLVLGGVEGQIPVNITTYGEVSTPTITVTPTTETKYSMTGVGALPSCILPVFSATVSGETLVLGWTDGSFSAGTLPTRSSFTAVTGITSATSSQPEFTPEYKALGLAVESGNIAIDGTFTPSGTVSQPTFTGTANTVSVTTTDAVTAVSGVVNTTASGGIDIKPEGTVSAPTLTKTYVKPSVAATSGTVTSTGTVSVITTDAVTAVSGSVNTTSSGGIDIKPAGTVSQPTFTGTIATITTYPDAEISIDD